MVSSSVTEHVGTEMIKLCDLHNNSPGLNGFTSELV